MSLWDDVKQYAYNVGIAGDRLANALIGGDPEWTISARMGKAVRNGDCRLCYGICKVLAWFDHRHCYKSYKWHDNREL
jgi:hypothetical protein